MADVKTLRGCTMKVLMLTAALVLGGCAAGTSVATDVPTDGPTEVPVVVTLEPTEAPDPTGALTPAPPDEPTRYKAGETILLTSDGADWAEVVIDRVKQVKRYDGPYDLDDVPKKGHVYLQLRVTYRALANGVDYGPGDWQMFVSGEASGDSTYVSNGPEPQLDYGTLPKGRKANGYVVFEIPTRGQALLSYGGQYGDQAPVFEVVVRSK